MRMKEIKYSLSPDLRGVLDRYAKYAELPRETCIKLFLWNQRCFYKSDPEQFLELWNKKRYQKSNEPDRCIRIPVELFEDLADIATVIDTKMNILAVNMIRMELDFLFMNQNKDIIIKKSEIKKAGYRGIIHMSDVVRGNLEFLAREIGIPLNYFISDILLRYLIENYPEFADF